MMSAMMLPSVTPFASMYTRTFTERRAVRVAAFATGYRVVLVEKSFVRGPGIARAFGVVALTLAVLVVFTPGLARGLRPSPPGAMSNPTPGGM